MKFLDCMEKENMNIEKRIFCTPQKKEGRKREPIFEQRATVEIGGSGYTKITFSDVINGREIWFTDQKSFLDFVQGLNETVALLNKEIN